ncbi:MAG: DUF2938 domain-containing protein [Xanthobacteraceae bacterium]
MYEIWLRAVAVGLGATLLMDAWGLLLKHLYDVKGLDYRFVGRWIGHMTRGQFSHADIRNAPATRYEAGIGWAVHYTIGILFALALVAAWGRNWLEIPTLLPALVTGLLTLSAPLFIMQPAFGFGFASSRTPNPMKARARSLITHTIFGLGLFVTAKALASSF